MGEVPTWISNTHTLSASLKGDCTLFENICIISMVVNLDSGPMTLNCQLILVLLLYINMKFCINTLHWYIW